jgi:hypothetical protein
VAIFYRFHVLIIHPWHTRIETSNHMDYPDVDIRTQLLSLPSKSCICPYHQ